LQKGAEITLRLWKGLTEGNRAADGFNRGVAQARLECGNPQHVQGVGVPAGRVRSFAVCRGGLGQLTFLVEREARARRPASPALMRAGQCAVARDLM